MCFVINVRRIYYQIQMINTRKIEEKNILLIFHAIIMIDLNISYDIYGNHVVHCWIFDRNFFSLINLYCDEGKYMNENGFEGEMSFFILNSCSTIAKKHAQYINSMCFGLGYDKLCWYGTTENSLDSMNSQHWTLQ